MTRGISKVCYTKKQQEYIDSVHGQAHQSAVSIIGDLDKQWLPIDENTPKDRKILLLWPELGVMEGEWVVDVFWCDMWELTGCVMDEQPTHWQELPEPPK